MSDKNIILQYSETGITTYCIIREESTGYLYDQLDGDFRPSPNDEYLELSEHITIKGLYEATVPDAGEPAWDNGRYTIICYKQASSFADPVSDNIIGQGDMYIVDDTEIILNADVSKLAFQGGMVWIDSVNGSAGVTYPLGTALNPVDNFANALTIANANGINSFHVTGSVTIGGSDDVSGMSFNSNGQHSTIAVTSGCTTTNTEFRGHIHLSGTFNGHVHIFESHLSPSVNIEGFFIDCLFDEGNYSLKQNTISRFINCYSAGQQGQSISLNTDGTSTDLTIWSWEGKLELTDKTGSTTFDIEMKSGELDIDSSCTTGRIDIRGFAEVSDNSGAGCNVVLDRLFTRQIDSRLSVVHGAGTWDIATVITGLTDIKGAGWVDENLTTIDTVIDAIKVVTDALPNSGALTDIDTGVNNIEAKLPSKTYLMGSGDADGGFDSEAKADINTEADTALSDYDPPTRTEATSDKDEVITQVNANETKIDSLDTQVKRILGLLHENVKYTNPTFDSDNNLTRVTITIYDDNTLTNSIASYTWTATGDGAGKFSVAQQVKN